ncbi:MAG: phage tail protein [Planctomycetes bacterium]|nr:phage tail protein [Planctomycetota bacterium]
MKRLSMFVPLLAAAALLVGSESPDPSGLGRMTAEILLGGEESIGVFVPVDSPSTEVQVIEFRDGTGMTSLLAGPVRAGSILFEAGLERNDALIEWHMAASTGGVAKREGIIVLRDDEGQELARHVFFGGWIPRLELFHTTRAGFMGRVVNRFELSVDTIERVEGPQ